MISKELLSEVLNLNMWKTETITIKYDCNKIEWNGLFLGDCGYYKSFDYINIYELAHKCKEWAFNQGYELFSRILSNDSQMRGNCLIIKAESDPETVLKIENEKTEPEAIFKACQWILDNKDK